MNILIPVNKKDRFQAQISSIEENNSWALVWLDSGKINSVKFYQRADEIECFIDNLVVLNSMEFFWPFLEYEVKVYMTSKEKSIDEIVEALLLEKLVELKK